MMPSERWPPYRWLWTHVVLARDPVTGEPTPYTHGVRRNRRLWLPIFVALFIVAVAYGATRRTRAPVWLLVALAALGFLAGHFFWCGG